MKFLFWSGLVILVLGIVSLFVPVPHKDREQFKAGGLSLDLERRHDQKLSPLASAVMILGGAGMMISGKTMRRIRG